MLDISVHIQHHPARRHLLPELTANLGSLPYEVVEDPGGEKPIAWRTYRECLLRASGADWTLVLQDDARLCPGFPQALRNALSAAGEYPVALFVPRTSTKGRIQFWQAQKEGRNWCTLDWREWVPVVALAWPRKHIGPFLHWAEEHGYGPQRWRADDAIVGEWARMTRTRVLATIPCLVDHPELDVSLAAPLRRGAAHMRRPRVALAFADHTVADVDWTR